MRTLSSIQGKSTVQVDINIDVQASDKSTTWTFSLDRLVNMSPISWENKIDGGLAVPSAYNITLSSSLGWIKDNIKLLNRAVTDLKIIAGTDTFYPHKGRVRGVVRDQNDPNKFTLNVYDRFLDSNPKFPVASIVDSYSSAHPETFNDDIGYPVYYGAHLRPFYFFAVDCNLSSMIAPTNISSENHVNSVWYSSDKSLSRDTDNQTNLLMNGVWNQDAAGNTFDANNPFEVQGLGPNDNRLFSFGSKVMTAQEVNDLSLDFISHTDQVSTSYFSGNDGVLLGGYETDKSSGSANKSYMVGTEVIPRFSKSIDTTNYIKFSAVHSATNISSAFVNYRIAASSGDSFSSITFVGSSIGDPPYSYSFEYEKDTGVDKFLTKNYKNYLYVYINNQTFTRQSSTQPTLTFSLECKSSFFSSKFSNYSIYSTPVNTGDIAVSENPLYILSDIFDQTSLSYVASQNSAAQSDVSSYKLNCLFAERENVSNIIDEFGKITKTNMWIGDSGTMNFRTYQDSANATVDMTVTTSDMFSFVLKESPIGSTVYASTKYKNFNVDYGYDFSTKKYESSEQANPTNNSFCDSVDAAGIDNELRLKTKYILNSDTASYYIGNTVAFNTQDNEYVEMTLPPRFFELELSDIIKVEHPMIVGESSVYQVVSITHNYISGNVSVKGQELLNLS